MTFRLRGPFTRQIKLGMDSSKNQSRPDHFVEKQSTWSRVKLTVSLQKWSAPGQYFDGSVPNFLCRVNSLLVIKLVILARTPSPNILKTVGLKG